MKRLLALPVIMLTMPAAMCKTVEYQRIACITPAQLEELRAAAPPKVKALLTGKADEDLRIIAANAVRLRGYSEDLLGVLGSCSG